MTWAAPAFAGLVQESEGLRLAMLAATVPSDQAIVELGSHTGLSTCWLAGGSEGAHVFAIDPWGDPRPGSNDDPLGIGPGDNVLALFRANIRAEGHTERVTPIRARSVDVAPYWVQPVGLLFIDAVHEYAAVVADLLDWAHLIPPGGWLALHDYTDDPEHPYAGVAKAIRDTLLLRRWTEPDIVGKPEIGEL